MSLGQHFQTFQWYCLKLLQLFDPEDLSKYQELLAQ